MIQLMPLRMILAADWRSKSRSRVASQEAISVGRWGMIGFELERERWRWQKVIGSGNKFEGRLKKLAVGLYGSDDKGKIGGIVCRFSSLYLSLGTRNYYKMISKRKIPSFNPHYHTLEMRPSLLFSWIKLILIRPWWNFKQFFIKSLHSRFQVVQRWKQERLCNIIVTAPLLSDQCWGHLFCMLVRNKAGFHGYAFVSCLFILSSVPTAFSL